MSTTSISWGKDGRCLRPTTLPPSCVIVTQSVNLNFLEPSWPLQACNGTNLSFLHNTQGRKIYLIGRIFRRNCRDTLWKERQKDISDGKTEKKELLDDLKETDGYWKLEMEALDLTLWRTGFERDYGPVARRSTT